VGDKSGRHCLENIISLLWHVLVQKLDDNVVDFVFKTFVSIITSPEKSTRGQRKHSFEANVDLAYIFHLFQFSRYIREPFQKSRYGNIPKKRFGLTNSANNILVRSIGTDTPIVPVLFHPSYIGPVLVIPPRLFRGRDHLFTNIPQHFLCHVSHQIGIHRWSRTLWIVTMVTDIVNCEWFHKRAKTEDIKLSRWLAP
jgi:hypothetical protein